MSTLTIVGPPSALTSSSTKTGRQDYCGVFQNDYHTASIVDSSYVASNTHVIADAIEYDPATLYDDDTEPISAFEYDPATMYDDDAEPQDLYEAHTSPETNSSGQQDETSETVVAAQPASTGAAETSASIEAGQDEDASGSEATSSERMSSGETRATTETAQPPTGTHEATATNAPPATTATRPEHTEPIVVYNSLQKQPDIGPYDTAEADSTPHKKVVYRRYKTVFIQSSFTGFETQYRWLIEKLDGCSMAQRQLFLHVLVSGMIRHDDEHWVPVSSRLMHGQLPACPDNTELVWRPLVEKGLLEVYNEGTYSHLRGESRTFRVPADVAQDFALADFMGAATDKQVNLLTGKPYRGKTAAKTLLVDESKNKMPHLVDSTLRHFRATRRSFNRAGVMRHLKLLHERLQDAERVWTLEGRKADTAAHKTYLKAQRKLTSDVYCFVNLLKQDARQVDGDIWDYQPAYQMQPLSGRLSEKGGCLQSASRPMKAAAMLAMYFNFDLVSSQLNALKQGYEEAEMDTALIDDLLAADKANLAARCGISVDTYKACLYALLFHGSLYPTLAEARQAAERAAKRTGEPVKLGAIATSILEDAADPDAAYAAFYALMEPLHASLKAWQKWLTTTRWKSVRQKGKKGYFAKNDCGVVFWIDDYEKGHERTSKMAAWYLQGREACFVHHLTLLGAKYGYTAVANEHDGLITDALIPAEAIAEAHSLANFTYATLTIKSIGTPLWQTSTTPQTNTKTSTITTTRHGKTSPALSAETICDTSLVTTSSTVSSHPHRPHPHPQTMSAVSLCDDRAPIKSKGDASVALYAPAPIAAPHT